MTPDPITARVGINKLGAVLCSVFVAFPLFFAIDLTLLFSRHDRVAAGDWILVGVLYVVALLVAVFCFWLWRKPQWRGVWVDFRNSGIDVLSRTIWGRENRYKLDWNEIEKVYHVELPRNASYIALRVLPDAAIQKELMRTTTRKDASAKLVSREVRIAIGLVRESGAEIVRRLEQSAENAGYVLNQVASLNLLAYERYVWTVEAKTGLDA